MDLPVCLKLDYQASYGYLAPVWLILLINADCKATVSLVGLVKIRLDCVVG